jgi:hypothetical protein
MTLRSETARFSSASGTIKEPGWYPDRINPNVQNYWDGHGWSAQRRWEAGRWSDVEMGRPTDVRGRRSSMRQSRRSRRRSAEGRILRSR